VIADVLHFSFTVSDIEASIDWYTRVLGLELVHRQRQENEYTPILVGIPGAVLEVAQFAVPGVPPARSTHMLELVEYITPHGPEVAPPPPNAIGCPHLALLVTDIRERYVRMRELGVTFRNPPVEITAGANTGGLACYFHDPDGITFELLQPAVDRLRSLGLTSD
jgi:catechol 2,3-dioxygenase-like lactoylglutathione lyase family enzyme